MGEQELISIKQFFEELNINPQYLEHESVITSEDAAKTRGFELKQGIKAILFTNDKDGWVITNLPADKKVDVKQVATQMTWSKSSIRMANPEEVIEKTGCEIGAVPPFNHKQNIPILVDKGIYNNDMSTFNIGLKTNSVMLKTIYLKSIFEKVHAVEGIFSK